MEGTLRKDWLSLVDRSSSSLASLGNNCIQHRFVSLKVSIVNNLAWLQPGPFKNSPTTCIEAVTSSPTPQTVPCMINLICFKALIYCTFPQYSQDQDYPDLLWYLWEVNPNVVLCYGNRNTPFVMAELLLSVSAVNQTAQVTWGLSGALEFLCLLLKGWGSSFSAWLLSWKCSEWSQRSFKVGGC